MGADRGGAVSRAEAPPALRDRGRARLSGRRWRIRAARGGAGRPASAIGGARGARGASASASPVSGPVWYTRTLRSMHESLPAGGITRNRRGFTRRHGPEVRFNLRVSEETWVGVDGTIRDRTVVVAVRFDSGADRVKWRAYGRPVPNFNNVWLGWISHDGIDVAGGRFPPQPGYQAASGSARQARTSRTACSPIRSCSRYRAGRWRCAPE